MAGAGRMSGAWTGITPPKVTAAREFLELFHDEELALRPAREVQKSFILPSTEPVGALQEVQAHSVRRIARRYKNRATPIHRHR